MGQNIYIDDVVVSLFDSLFSFSLQATFDSGICSRNSLSTETYSFLSLVLEEFSILSIIEFPSHVRISRKTLT